MPRLILQFEELVLKEYSLGGNTTIGRLPDNTVVIDNPAVSGHHACISRDGDLFVVEDLQSTNGTFVNEKRAAREMLRNNDVLKIGKHTLVFDASAGEDRAVTSDAKPHVPDVEGTMFLDTRQHRALLAKLGVQAEAKRTKTEPRSNGNKIGVLRVIDGNAERSEFSLDAQTSLIGKADASLIRLKGWFTPSVAVTISRDGGAYVATLLGRKTRINHERRSGRHHLKEGDLLEVGGLLLEFRLKS